MRVRIGTMTVVMSLLLGGAVALGGCSDEHANHAGTDNRASEAQMAEAATSMGRVVKANFELVEALSRDDLERSRRAAEQAREALKPLAAEHDAAVPKMDEALAKVVESQDLAAMRNAFQPFSHELIELVRAQGAGDAGATHVALCPMVNDDNGYWLQPQKQITNPYWGARMYRCGRIVETVQE